MLDAAAALFGERGWAGTTMAAIAQRAGVSVETVNLNGPKRDLLIAATQRAAAGDEGEHSILERDEPQRILAERDIERLLDGIARYAVWSSSRTFGLWQAFAEAAAADPHAAKTFAENVERIRDDARRVVAAIGDVAELRGDVDREELADTLWPILGPDAYRHLVTRCGWSHERLERWTARMLRDTLAGAVAGA